MVESHTGANRVAESNSARLRSRTVLTGLGLALSALPAASPYLKAGFPRTNDALAHLFRALALDQVIAIGRILPRWMPDLVLGLGYPVANFFPALSHLLVELIHLLGMPLTTAYRGVVVLHFMSAAWCTFLLAKDEFGSVAGWVAAVSYVYSPYLLYDAHVRGSLPEGLALSLIPLVLLFLRKAAQEGGRWVVLTGLAFAGAFLSHHGIVFQSLIVIGMWLVWLGWRGEWRDLWNPIVGLALGVLITSFFWLPSLAEVRYVQGQEAIGAAVNYRDNFLSFAQMLELPRLPADPALVNPPVVRSLPLVTLGAVLLILPLRWQCLSRSSRWQAVFWLGLVLVCTLLITPIARPVWDVLPLLKLTIFPWRLLGPASLAAALGLGAALAEMRMDARDLILTVSVTVLLLLGGVAWLYPPREPVTESPTMADLVAFEQPPLLIGTTTYGEFLPCWVEELPVMTDLQGVLAAGESPDRLLTPENVEVKPLSVSPLRSVYDISVDSPVTLVYQQFYFPGWRVWLDDEALDIRPTDRTGLIEFDVPVGEHRLEVEFASTWARSAGNVLSGIGVAVVLIALARYRREVRVPLGGAEAAWQALPVSWIGVLTIVLLGAKFALDRIETPLHRSMLRVEGPGLAQHRTQVNFAGELQLLGYDLPSECFSAEDEVTITLYWQALHPIGIVYDRVVQVVDGNGLIWSTSDTARPADWRWAPGTDRWRVDEYVMDPFVLHLLDGTPPGNYAIRVSLVRRDTHQTVADHVVVQVDVTRPARGDRVLEPDLDPVLSVGQASQAIQLLAVGTDRDQAAPGDPMRVTLLWQVVDQPVLDSMDTVVLELVAMDERIAWSHSVPIAGQYPAALWQRGDRLRTEALFRLPVHLVDGRYTWRVVLDTGSAWTVGTLDIRNPERLWEPPPLDIEIGTSFEDVAVLLGASIDPPGQTVQPPVELSVKLVWQSLAETDVSYRVFLHLTDEHGRVVSQSDGEPAAWRRPTTGWLPGEVVLDERQLHLPADSSPGIYVLSCGLYDVASGRRLISSEGADGVLIGSLVIGAE